MKLIKLTVLASLIFSSMALFSSCEPDSELKKITDFSKSGIVLSGAQEVPANASSASGTMDVFYTRETRILSYTVTWTGLTDSVNNMHIHGLAPTGYNASPVQNIVTSSNSIFPLRTSGKLTFAKSGKLSGTLLVDGVAVKEVDLLNGLYYLNIHTSAFTGGEIRGQIVFQ